MTSDRTFFVTTVTIQRLPIFRRETTAKLLIETLAHYRNAGKFLLHEFVITPDHIHALLYARGNNFLGTRHAIHQRRILLSAQ